jgi:ribonuclease PH
LRPQKAEAPFLRRVPGSVLYAAGDTWVLCTAIFEEGVPPFLEGSDRGWITAEYELLPAATQPRHPRERGGKLSGRTQEIQRLIGRALRAAVDLTAIPGMTLKIDCDVLQADGGTRTASVNGAWIAAARAIEEQARAGRITRPAIVRQVAALSVGILEGNLLLDMSYEEDCRVDVDLTVAMDTQGSLIEIQGTAERNPLSEAALGRMIALARKGLEEVFQIQRKALGGS